MQTLKPATRTYIDGLIARRKGETKFGELVDVTVGEDWKSAIVNSRAKFVLLGVPEDIGVRANYGVGGTYTLWEPALKAILNVQHTTLLTGNSLFILGSLDFTEEMQQQAEGKDVKELRELVKRIDEAVHEVALAIMEAGKVPIIIGGGHNNAYPLLKAASQAQKEAVNCINLDAHSDYRAIEGRHSGNGFRYAYKEGYLKKYAIVGLHENYNAQNIIDELRKSRDFHFSYYEDVFVRGKMSFYEAVAAAQQHVAGKPSGLELDMDCIENILSSAMTPVGITPLQARQYVNWCARSVRPVYFHLTEGAVSLADGRESGTTAKMAAYLVTDFMKAWQY